MLDAEKSFDEVRQLSDTRKQDFIPVRNLRDKLKFKKKKKKKNQKYSPGARDVLCNPGDRKGLTMNFDRLKHPPFGKVVRGLKLWYNVELYLCFNSR